MIPLAFGFGGPVDIAIVAGVALILFGGTKLKDFGKSLGEGLSEFKKATREDTEVKEAPVAKAPAVNDSTTKVE